MAGRDEPEEVKQGISSVDDWLGNDYFLIENMHYNGYRLVRLTMLKDTYLFRRTHCVDEREYRVALYASFIKSAMNPWEIVLLQEVANAKSFLLMGYRTAKKELMPIVRCQLNTAIDVLQHISCLDDPEVERLLNQMQLLDDEQIKMLQPNCYVKLSNSIKTIVSDGNDSFRSPITVDIIVPDNKHISPQLYVYAAFEKIHSCAYFEIEKTYLQELKSWGILTPIRVYTDNDFAGEYLTQQVWSYDEKITLVCQMEIDEILGIHKMGGAHMEGIDVYQLTDFIVSSAGQLNKVQFPDNYPFNTDWYTVIFPLDGIIIEQESGIGNVEFLRSDNEEVIRAASFFSQLSGKKGYALVNVNERRLYNAYSRAFQQIGPALDFLISMVKDDSLFSVHSAGGTVMERSRKAYRGKVSISPMVYIEMPLSQHKFACNLVDLIECQFPVVNTESLPSPEEIQKYEQLLLLANGENDADITPLFDSLKWVRRAWDADNADDQIIYAITALEFIVSKEKNVPLLEKRIISKIKGEIRKILSEEKDEKLSSTDFMQRICDKISNACTETPFRGKLMGLINRLDIPLTESEIELINAARKRRNDIIHGSGGSPFSENEVYRLCTIISRIALYKMKSMEINDERS